MSRLGRPALLVVALALALVGCPGGERPQPSADRSATPLRPKTAEPAPIYDVDIAVPADYEEEAAQEVGRDTYKAVLAAVEAEMAR